MRIEEKEGRLAIVDFDEIEAYKIAVKIEKDGLEFYRSLAALLEGSPQATIRFLLEEEKKHLLFFENCIAGLRQMKEDDSEDNDLLESMDYGIFAAQGGLRETSEALRVPERALALGMVMENRSIAFYRACAGALSSSQTKEALRLIIEEEQKHKHLLSQLLNERNP